MLNTFTPGPTPGPWRTSPLTKAHGIYAQDGTPIAKVVGAYGVSAERRLADADLIAAAPDMLAALRAIVFQVCQGKVLERDACITQARAAMARAEGRQ